MLEFAVNFLAATIRTATPLLIASLGLVFSERAGIVNIGTEGIMLSGALLGCIGSFLFESSLMGALFAATGGALLGLIFAFFTVTLRSSQVVVGFSMNIFAMGLTVTLNRLILNGVRVSAYPSFAIPGLSRIPTVGPSLFTWPLLVYFALLAVPLSWYILYKTNTGLKIRAVGNHPKACDTVGINVFKIRYGAVVFSGVMSGLAGSFVSMGQLSLFVENMVAGGGFMALAVVVFGNYSPGSVLGASLLFGASDALKFRLLMTPAGTYYQFMNMLPYFITIVALCFFARRSNKPAFSAVPYKKD